MDFLSKEKESVSDFNCNIKNTPSGPFHYAHTAETTHMLSVKNAFLLENASHHLSSLRAGTFLLVAVLAPMVVAAEAGGLWQFPKTRRQPRFLHRQTLPFTDDFSAAGRAVWWHFTHRRTSFKTGVHPLDVVLLYQLHLCDVLSPCCPRDDLHGIFTGKTLRCEKLLAWPDAIPVQVRSALQVCETRWQLTPVFRLTSGCGPAVARPWSGCVVWPHLQVLLHLPEGLASTCKNTYVHKVRHSNVQLNEGWLPVLVICSTYDVLGPVFRATHSLPLRVLLSSGILAEWQTILAEGHGP